MSSCHTNVSVGVPTFSAMAEAYDSGSDETCSPERRRQGVQPPQRSCLARLELLKRQLEVCCPGLGVDGWAPCRDVHAASYVGVGDGQLYPDLLIEADNKAA